jgi:hypothetical protein
MGRATLEWVLEIMHERVRHSVQLPLWDSPKAIAYIAGSLDAINILIEKVSDKLKDGETR